VEGVVIAGRYRLVRLLGKGGMGSVWLAEHTSLGTSVAVKLINSELANHASSRARFAREAQLAARIRSAHVAQIHDHGVTEDGIPYIAMEYLAGESLSDRLEARGSLTLHETARVLSHVSRALSRAHAVGLVHRDIKPENIFIAREGSDEIIKVVDFGVAKAVDALGTGYDQTRTGALMGTPYYMSPEQAQGLKSIDSRSDLWSLGVVVFECLTGAQPFTAPALGPLIAKIVAAPIPVPSLVAPAARIPVDVDAWMARALARSPDERFSSAEEFAQSFEIASGAVQSFQRPSDPPLSSENGPKPRAVIRFDDSFSGQATRQELDATMQAPPPPAPALAAASPTPVPASPRGSKSGIYFLAGTIVLALGATAVALILRH
jgi:serine/threonine-protein kinase